MSHDLAASRAIIRDSALHSQTPYGNSIRNCALLDDAAGDVDGPTEHLLDLEPRHQRLEMTPRPSEALERARRTQRGVPYQEIQRHRADGRPLESGRDDSRT